MTVVVGALLGLLSTLGATAHGVTIGRQRTIGTSLAKQAIETLQGAAYSSVAMSLTGLSTEPLVHGTAPNQTFEGEPVVLGGTTPYSTTVTSAGTTFSIRMFVTAVSGGGAGYRRMTVLVGWPSIAPLHTLRFSSLVYPLNYASYPASSGEAEVTGGLISVDGALGGDTLSDVHVVLPGARVDTNSSTLRTSIGSAANATSYVAVQDGPIASTTCTGAGSNIGECLRQTVESVADNDSTSTTGNWVAGVGQAFAAGSVTTPGGATIVTPAGTMTSRASTDLCGPCGFGDNDGQPWADSSVGTSSGSSAHFISNHGSGSLQGDLWTLGSAWAPSASVDHDPTGGGIVTASAQLLAPALQVLDLQGGPGAFDGAIKVGAFSAKASAISGYTLIAPDVSTGTTTIQVQLWDGSSYRTVNITPGAALDTTAAGSFTIGDHVIAFTSRVQAQGSTLSTSGTAPRSDANAQHSSLLVVTVAVTISSIALGTPPPTTTTTTVPAPTTTSTASTSTTSTTIPTTTTTAAPIPVMTDSFTIVVDYGRVSVHDTWLAKAP